MAGFSGGHTEKTHFILNLDECQVICAVGVDRTPDSIRFQQTGTVPLGRPSCNSGGSTCAAGAGVLTLSEGRWERAVWKGTVFIIADPNRVRAAMQVRVQQSWTLALLRGY